MKIIPSENPDYPAPKRAHVTIREILIWIVAEGEVTMAELAEEFDITSTDASVRLQKLHRWGYIRRRKSQLSPKVYHYRPSAFGRKTVLSFKKKRNSANWPAVSSLNSS